MTITEFAKIYGSENVDKSMKNKNKAKEIAEKILTCPKCGKQMDWIKNTNICVCPTCVYTIGKNENKKVYSITKTLPDRSYKFLENNYDSITKESTEV